MRLWDLIRTLDAQVRPTDTKVHLATHNGIEHPLDLYRDRPERFREWQQWQTKKNFQRAFVIALIELPEARHWLFAGAYSARSSRPDGTGHLYQLIERGACQEFDGRLVVQFKRSGRQPYLRAENWADQMLIAEWRAERLSIQKFPGFKRVHIAKTQLDAIVRQRCPDWQAALSNVAGVYLIADSGSGRFYVGSATGAGGIWHRYCSHAIMAWTLSRSAS